MKQIAAAVLAVASCLSTTSLVPPDRTSYVVDPTASKLEIHVYREGFFKAFGHDHLISPATFSGQVEYAAQNLKESSVRFTVETNSLVVLDPDESEKDRKEVQATMLGEKVLYSAKYPQIAFVSAGIRSVAQKDDTTEIQLDGTLSLHGVQKPVTVPLRLRTNASVLEVEGEISIVQTDFGMIPIKVGGGAVRVKDKLKISFRIIARPGTAPKDRLQ